MDLEALIGLLAEPFRQVEEGLGDPPGTSVKTRLAVTSLARRSRCTRARSMCSEISGRLRSNGSSESCGRTASVTSVTALALDVRGRGSNSDSSPNISPARSR